CRCFLIQSAPSLIYTLSLHDALPISCFPPVEYRSRDRQSHNYWHDPSLAQRDNAPPVLLSAYGSRTHLRAGADKSALHQTARLADRKSTRLNSSHVSISYAVFCLKKK